MLQMSTFCHLINEFLFIFSSERHEKDIVSNKRNRRKRKKSHNDSFLYFFHSSRRHCYLSSYQQKKKCWKGAQELLVKEKESLIINIFFLTFTIAALQYFKRRNLVGWQVLKIQHANFLLKSVHLLSQKD